MTKSTAVRKHMGKVVFDDELSAKIALARRVWKDKGEIRYYPCRDEYGTHYHLTSEAKREAVAA